MSCRTNLLLTFFLFFVFSLSACKQESNQAEAKKKPAQTETAKKENTPPKPASKAEVEKLVEQFILAENGSTINIPAGHFELETQLILDNLSDVKIVGQGMDKSIVSFKNLKAGGEGMKIVGNNVLMKDFSVHDAPGDGIRAQNCDGITFRRVNATWTNNDKSKNGTYAIYPVSCKNVLVDECKASHSRDAGIYVGQSENVVVKNCEAYGNVAGIEIENCINSEVFDNKAYDNSAGILVFNLPNIPLADGKKTRVYNNEITANNHVNFATAISETANGNTITLVPPGSGIILLAAKEVEIFDNKILENKTVGIAIASYQITGFPAEAPNWSPFTSDISIHDNEFKRSNEPADSSKDLGKLIGYKNAHGPGKGQDIIYDGIWNPAKGGILDNPMNICIDEKEMSDLLFTRLDVSKGLAEAKGFKESKPFECKASVKTSVEALKKS